MNPELEQQLEAEKQKLIEELENNYEMIEQIQNQGVKPHTFDTPKEYAKLKQIFSDAFIEKVQDVNYTDEFEKIESFNYHVVAGPISAGKSSLISEACKVDLPIGIGETTKEVHFACLTQNNTYVIDTPGVNQKFAFFDLKTLSIFNSADFIFYCFRDSLKNSIEVLKIIQKMKPGKFCVIRTQVDRIDEHDFKTISEELETDREILFINDIQAEIYAISIMEGPGFRDNWEIFNKLKGVKEQIYEE